MVDFLSPVETIRNSPAPTHTRQVDHHHQLLRDMTVRSSTAILSWMELHCCVLSASLLLDLTFFLLSLRAASSSTAHLPAYLAFERSCDTRYMQ